MAALMASQKGSERKSAPPAITRSSSLFTHSPRRIPERIS
jgi:hypothetical protein